MISLVLALVLARPQGIPGEPPILRVGETLTAEITDRDPVIHTPNLDATPDAPIVARSVLVEVDEPGTYTLELRSHVFDAYLVLYDESDEIQVEDDDGLIGYHSRIVVHLDPGIRRVDACALHGQRGQYELALVRGKPPTLSLAERARAQREELERSLAAREKAYGPEHFHTGAVLNELAKLLQDQGELAAARPLSERALAICEKECGPEHPATAGTLSNLARQLYLEGDFEAARPLAERALAIHKKVHGPGHPETATSLNNLGTLLQAQGDYATARRLCENGLAIREIALGPEHPGTARALMNLARLLQDQGDYAAARPLFERGVAINEKALGPEHTSTAASLGNLASLLHDQGDYPAARLLYERALAIDEKALGPEHPDTGVLLSNLALLLQVQGDYAAARVRLERVLAIREKVLGPEHPETATSLNNLAALLRDQGDHAAARPLFERALAIDEKTRGPEHPAIATRLNNLAIVVKAQCDFAAARPLYEQALVISENALGLEHPFTAKVHSNLGRLLADLGCLEESRIHALSALIARLRHAEKTLWSLSEHERLSYLGLGEEMMRGCLSDSERSAVPENYELALAWRGLASRSLVASRAQLRASLPADAVAAIEKLIGIQTELSKRLYAIEIPDPEQHERELRDLRQQRNAMEVAVQRLSGPSLARAPKLAELEQSLAPEESFLDFFVHPFYRPAERKGERVVRKGEWSEDHLSAWIVRKGRALLHVDLGPSAPIEAAVKGWLDEVVSHRGIATAEGVKPEQQAGARLCALLWEPLRGPLDGVTRVFVRPDSFLGTLPFGVIPLEGGKFLIEELDFVYLQAPGDLLQEQTRSTATSLLAVGGIDFKKRAALEADTTPTRSIVASTPLTEELRGSLNSFWSRLPHTENEAQTVHDLFEASFDEERLLLIGDAPTEERLKRELPSHAYAHLATHGFFHPAGTVSLWDSARAAAEKDAMLGLEHEAHALVGELPGLLSGLVCAGANEPAQAGRDDGLLTAEEVLWLDLSHVELVVLSACETALGERRAGEGMIGLRRAFGLAGAKTVVSSLWAVKDRSTSEFMQRFYQNLLVKKQGRAEALRNAQLELLAENRASERDALPSTWAAFVLAGEWR